MTPEKFTTSVIAEVPSPELSVPLAALCWDAKGDWERAHSLVDELESPEGMAVHAYLHRKQGAASNAEYWYLRAGRSHYRPEIEAEWQALVEALLTV